MAWRQDMMNQRLLVEVTRWKLNVSCCDRKRSCISRTRVVYLCCRTQAWQTYPWFPSRSPCTFAIANASATVNPMSKPQLLHQSASQGKGLITRPTSPGKHSPAVGDDAGSQSKLCTRGCTDQPSTQISPTSRPSPHPPRPPFSLPDTTALRSLLNGCFKLEDMPVQHICVFNDHQRDACVL